MNLDPRTDVAIGRILRPWGRRGAVIVEPLTHDRTRFDRLGEIGVRVGTETSVRRVRGVRYDRRERPMVEFEGVDSISAAEELRGGLLVVPEEFAERPDGDTFFNHELVGCDVSTVAGAAVGLVDRIVETGGGNLLVVRDGTRELLVPTVRSVLVEVDVTEKRLTIDPPQGLLDLNQPGAERAV